MDEQTPRRTLFQNSPNQRNASEASARGLKEAIGQKSPHQLRKMIQNQDSEITRLSSELVKAKEAIREHKDLSGQLEDLRQTIAEQEEENRALRGLFENLSRTCGDNPKTGTWVIGEDAQVPKALVPHFDLIRRVQNIVSDRNRLEESAMGLLELWACVAPVHKRSVIESLSDSPKMAAINKGLGMAARHASGGEPPNAVAKAKAEGRILPFIHSTATDKF